MADAGSIWVKLGLKDQEFNKGLSSITSSLGKIAGIAGVAFGVKEIFNYGREAMNLAGIMEGVSAAFARLNQPDLLANLQKATRGTVDNLSLMKAAVRADNFKVPLDKLASFFEFATKRSAQTGESVDYLVNSIVDGIGRKSTLVMDNLGISAAELQTEIKKTGDFGKAAGNIIERELAKAGDVATTSAQKMASWGASMTNLKLLIGTELNKALNALAPVIDSITKGLTQGFKNAKKDIVDVINYFIDLYNESEKIRYVIQAINNANKLLFNTILLGIESIALPLKNMGAAFADLLKGDFGGFKRNITEMFTETTDAFKRFGENTLENFNKGVEAAKTREKIPFIPDENDQNKINQIAYDSGAEAGNAFKKGYDTSQVKSDIEIDNALNESLYEQIDLENELAEVQEMRHLSEYEWAELLQEKREAVMNSYADLGGIISAMSNGIANAKGNWAALVGVVAGGIAKMIPAIKTAIAATHSLFVAKEAEAYAGAAASAGSVPFPGNLAAIAAGVAAVAATVAPFLGSFATGLDYVPYDGLAYIHEGERIVPKSQNTQAGMSGMAMETRFDGGDLLLIVREQQRFEDNTF